MLTRRATAIAHPNIALIKYWGDLDSDLHIPANGSISMNLAELFTRTSVRFEQGLAHDQFTLNDQLADSFSTQRVSKLLDRVRQMAGIEPCAIVESQNNFPTGTGIASSASGFAALILAACSATNLELDEKALSRLARLGSGSACRSIPGGFVEWQAGTKDDDSFAYTIAPLEHWDLVDCVVLVSQEEKTVSSSLGHSLAATSLYQPARLADAPRRLELCRNAIRMRDFDALAAVVELDSNLMHAVMMTSTPPLFYWQPTTLTIMQEVRSMRKTGLPVCYTIDAGPNVHVLCTGDVADKIEGRMRKVAGVYQVLKAHPGGPAKLE
jgi:diphosphomevalonate decarboxylase